MATALERKGGKMKLSFNEQSVVDEFTRVIRKHQDQAPTTLARQTLLGPLNSLDAPVDWLDERKAALV